MFQPAHKVGLVLSTLAVLHCAAPAIADEQYQEQPPSFNTAGKFSHLLQKYTGLTFLGNRIASWVGTGAVSTVFKGRATIKVRSYNFSDLLQGEFRSVEVKLYSGKYKGVPIGSVRAKTVTPLKITRRGVAAPVLIQVEGEASEKLVARALESKTVTENLRFLKLDLPGLGEQRLQVLNPRVDVLGDRVQVTTNLITANANPETGIKLMVSAAPAIEKERFIILKDIQVSSDDIQKPVEFANFIEQLLNPLFDFGRLDRATHAFRITKFEVKNERIRFAGRLLLAPKPSAKLDPAKAS